MALLLTANIGSAQIAIQNGDAPVDFQRQFRDIFQQVAAQQGLPLRSKVVLGLRWGGLQLEKASPDLQAQLGLEDTEGLIVAGVEPNSVGEKAGVKTSDVLLKIGAQTIPNDAEGFGKLVKDQKENEPIDLVVIRKGKEETLKGVKMPALVQNSRGGPAIGGIGGIGGRPGTPHININNGGFQLNLFSGGGKVNKLHVEMSVNGATITKKQDDDKFSGEYVKGDLKVTVNGIIENLQNKITEITVMEGKDSKKYTSLRRVPAKHQLIVQQLLPSPFANMMILPAFPRIDLPGLLPAFDD